MRKILQNKVTKNKENFSFIEKEFFGTIVNRIQNEFIMIQEKISIDVSGKRLDQYLAKTYPHLSRTYFQKLISEELVLCNGKPVKKREKVAEGDEIEVCFTLTEELAIEPENIPLTILYEDEHLIAIDKPAGMVVHPAPGHYTGTFVSALLHHCAYLPEGSDPKRPGIVHRLDKETSGVLLAAKSSRAHRALVASFAAREVEKTYLAICVGSSKEGTFSFPIGRHKSRRKEMAIVLDGREAISGITILQKDSSFSLAEVKPKTGRTHQIRVHLRHLGAPVLGDSLYGFEAINEKFGIKRHFLHAHRITLPHPISKEPLTIEAPIPDDMKEFLSKRDFVVFS